MAVIGSLGDIAFEVSSNRVRTIKNMKWSSSANYATHQLHAGNTLTEFTGCDPDKISFDMSLSVYLGVDPAAEIDKLLKYKRSATILPLVIGSKSYGRYRWTILSHEVKGEYYDKKGDLISATVSVSLQEYVRA